MNSFIYIFGILQLMCLVTSPLIGSVMDYKIKETLDNLKGNKSKDSANKRAMSISSKTGDDNVFSEEPTDIVKSNGRKFSLPDVSRPSMFGNFVRNKSFDLGRDRLGSWKSRLSSTDSNGSDTIDGEKPPMSLKIRKLLNGSYAFGITNTLLMFFGITVLVPSLNVQVKKLLK